MAEDDQLDEDLDEIESPQHGRIAFGVIETLTLFGGQEFEGALLQAMVPGTAIDRHGRTWLMGQVRVEGGSIVGRIGFQTANIAEIWDEKLRDFREDLLPAGTTSPFAIDLDRRRVAFQLRPGLIRVRSFTGALQALMNEADAVNRWRVSQEVEPMTFDEWVGTVDRIVRLRIRVRRPNPHYSDRERVRNLVEGANARMAQIVYTADPAALDGIDVGDEFIREAIAHAEHYGSYAASAERNDLPTAWGSDQEAAAEERVVEADPHTKEVPADRLREELRNYDEADTTNTTDESDAPPAEPETA